MDITDIENLLTLYRAGRRPPLSELVNDELLRIFQQGFAEESMSSFGILLPSQDYPEDSKERWNNGRFINSDARRQKHCRDIRNWKDKNGIAVFDDACDVCAREHAFKAATRREAIVYLCHAGMIDYAVPIVVDDHIVAVLSAGQQRPKDGMLWSRSFLEGDATKNDVAGEEDAWSESIHRKQEIMEQMKGMNLRKVPNLVQSAQAAPVVAPDKIPTSLRNKVNAASQLSRLAERTIHYQLNAIKAHFTSQVARLLPKSDNTFWTEFADFLKRYADFYETDYAFFCILNRPTDDHIKPAMKLPEGVALAAPPYIRKASFFPLRRNQSCKPVMLKPQEAKERIFNNSFLFDSACYVVPMEVNGPLGIVVMGNFKRKGLRKFLPSELQLIDEQFQEISIILENRRQLQARDEYVTDLAHEVKSPLAAVAAAAENLAASRVNAAEAPARVKEIRTRLRRLQMSVNRFGMLEKLLSKSELLVPKQVSAYDVAQECRGEYEELAQEKEMEIEVRGELRDLPRILMHREAFKHTLGNLVMNAIKYGDKATSLL